MTQRLPAQPQLHPAFNVEERISKLEHRLNDPETGLYVKLAAATSHISAASERINAVSDHLRSQLAEALPKLVEAENLKLRNELIIKQGTVDTKIALLESEGARTKSFIYWFIPIFISTVVAVVKLGIDLYTKK